MGLEQAGVDLLQGDVAAEGEAAPAPGDRVGLGGRLDCAQAPAPGVGEQLLAADAALLKAGASASRRRRSAGAKAWTSTSPSSAWPSDCSASGTAAAARAHQLAPKRGEDQPRPLGQGGEAVAVARRLAGEGDHAAGAQDAAEFGEGALQVGDVVKDGVAEDEVEALLLEGELLGLGRDRPHLQPERLGGTREPPQHPRGDVGRGQPLDHAELEQVEREVAGARADLQPVAEGSAPPSPPSALASFSRTCSWPVSPKSIPHLASYVIGRSVVVAGVDVLDVLRRGGRGGWHGRELYAERRNARSTGPPIAVPAVGEEYLQLNQPAGVPPLPLTGERTLPDLPEENYWYRRHLAVYEWIAARVAGLRVLDMACGEGYGSDLLAGAAASVVGVDANPEAHEHARLRYVRAEPALRARSGRELRRALRGDRLPADDRARPSDAGAILEHFDSMLAPGGAPTSRHPTCSPWRRRGPRSQITPGTCASTAPPSSAQLCEAHFEAVEMLGLFHARKLRAHEVALAAGLGHGSTAGSG